MFVHIRGRSTYSMLEWLGSVPSIFQKAKDLWQESIALTDLYGLYGVVDFYTKSKSFHIKPLIGVEIPFVPYIGTFHLQKWVSHPPTLTLLVRNAEGYHNLLRLVSAGYTNARDEIPFIDYNILQQFWTWLLTIIGGLNSYAHQLARDDRESLQDFVMHCIAACDKENCYIDITAQLYTDYPYLKQANEVLLSMAHQCEILPVVSSGYYYPDVSQKTAYETALAIKDGKKTYDGDARKLTGDYHHILHEQEVRDILQKNNFSDTLIEQLVNATGELADRCTTKITLGQALFPNFDTPPDIIALYEQYKDNLVE